MQSTASVVSPSRRDWLLLVLLVLLGACLRVYGLERQSLFLDELWSWNITRFGFAETMDGARGDVHPPLYFILLFLTQRHLGDSELLLRLPSAILGVIAVVLIFAVGKRLYTTKEALIAAAFTAVSWTPIYFSQEARGYSLLMCSALWCTYHFIPLMDGVRDARVWRWTDAAGYVIAALVCAYTHYFGLLWVTLQGGLLLGLMVVSRRVSIRGLGACLVLALGYLPWVPTMLTQFHRGPKHLTRPTLVAIPNFLAYSLGGVALTTVVVILLVVLTAQTLRREGKTALRPGVATSLLLYWAFAPFLLSFIQSWIASPVLGDRNLLVSAPAIYLLVARLVARIPMRVDMRVPSAAAGVVLLVGHLIFVQRYYTTNLKTQFRGAVDLVVAGDKDLKDSMILGYCYGTYCFDYYLAKHKPTKTIAAIAGRKADIPAVVNLVESTNPRFFWYVSGHRKPEREFVEALDTSFRLVRHDALLEADVRLYENERRRPAD